MMKRRYQWPVLVGTTGAVLLLLLLVPMLATAAVPTNVRLSNDAPTTGGYVSAYTLATGIPYTDAVLDRGLDRAGPPERARRRDRPARSAGDDRQLERLRRGLRRLDARQLRPGRSHLAGLLPLRERRRELRELAGPRLSGRHVAVCGARADPHGLVRRPRDRLGPARPRVHGLGELRRPGRLAEDLRRRMGGDLRESGRAGRQHPERRQAVRPLGGRGQGLVGAEPARQVQRQDSDRGGPHDEFARGQRLLLVVALHRQPGRREHLLLAFHRPRRDVVEADEPHAQHPRRPVPGHRDHRQRRRLRHLPSVRGPRRPARRGRLREVDGRRQDLRQAAASSPPSRPTMPRTGTRTAPGHGTAAT